MYPVLKYPGSKWNTAKWIISNMPRHSTYLEPYFGSGAVLLNKSPVKIETINDISGRVVNLFRVIREQPDELARAIYFTPWARDEYVVSDKGEGNPVENARRFLIRCWMAFGAKIDSKATWSQSIQADRRNNSRVRDWRRLPEAILAAADRLANVQIENRPALDVIRQYNYPDVLIYCDPPYLRSTRKLYPDEMTDADHKELLGILKKHKGPVMLSGYANELYDRELKSWRRETKKAIAELGKERTEILWVNREREGLFQAGMF